MTFHAYTNKEFSKKQLREYVLSKGILLPNGHVELTESIFAFKKVLTYPIYLDSGMDKKNTRRSVSMALKRYFNDRKYYRSEEAIANIMIPKGALINPLLEKSKKDYYLNSEYKMRADKVFTHSVIRLKDNKEVIGGFSHYRNCDPIYYGGFERLPYYELWDVTAIKIKNFDNTLSTCSTGIHFFADIYSALKYGYNQPFLD